jgi:DNA (cytosine-5)-methyltransferase 1
VDGGGVVTYRLLDLFCGAGGAAMGYHRAGFEVVGVDHRPMPRFPFEFHQADALTFPLDGFNVIHASPPCQGYSVSRHIHGSGGNWPDLIGAVRNRLLAPWVRCSCCDEWWCNIHEAHAADCPCPHVEEWDTDPYTPPAPAYVIENVMGAPLHNAVMLCGTMFGLKVFRHRFFECSHLLMTPDHAPHKGTTLATNAYSRFRDGATHICVAGNNYDFEDGKVAMGIDWMRTRSELSESIPPAMTEWIGKQLIRVLEQTHD